MQEKYLVNAVEGKFIQPRVRNELACLIRGLYRSCFIEDAHLVCYGLKVTSFRRRLHFSNYQFNT